MRRWWKLLVFLSGFAVGIGLLSAWRVPTYVSARISAREIRFTTAEPLRLADLQGFHKARFTNLLLTLEHVDVNIDGKEEFGFYKFRAEEGGKDTVIPAEFGEGGSASVLLDPGSTVALGVERARDGGELPVTMEARGNVKGGTLSFKTLEVRAQEHCELEGEAHFRELVVKAAGEAPATLVAVPGRRVVGEFYLIPPSTAGLSPMYLAERAKVRQVRFSGIEGNISVGKKLYELHPNDTLEVSDPLTLTDLELSGRSFSFAFRGHVASVRFNTEELVETLLETATSAPQWGVLGAAFFILVAAVVKGILADEEEPKRVEKEGAA